VLSRAWDVGFRKWSLGSRSIVWEAAWIALPLRPLAVLGEGQKPEAPAVRREAEEDWGR
jgi:hypothetical protein